jgi:uroporphyrinogen decarboxylase
MLSPVDYQEFSWKYINQIVEALADDAPVIVSERMLVRSWRNGKKPRCIRVDWTCSQKCKISFWWKHHFKDLIRQDCYRQFR